MLTLPVRTVLIIRVVKRGVSPAWLTRTLAAVIILAAACLVGGVFGNGAPG